MGIAITFFTNQRRNTKPINLNPCRLMSYQMAKAKLVSRCKIWLPLEENAAVRVVICAYEDQWIPITFTTLAEAIAIYQNVCLQGGEIFVFPSDFNPWNSYPSNQEG